MKEKEQAILDLTEANNLKQEIEHQATELLTKYQAGEEAREFLVDRRMINGFLV